LSHPSPAELLFQPLSPLPGNQVIEVELHGAHIRDTWGNEAADSLFRFHTVNPDTLSAIGGEVRDADSLAQGPILIRARQIGKEINTYKRWIKNTGTYYISDMLPGLYILEAFRDEDGNGRYSYGSIFPFRPAERFTVLPDTVKIRARWPNEGNDLELK